MDESLAQWNLENPNHPLTRADVIEPAFSFYNPATDQWAWLAWGETVPEGFLPHHEVYDIKSDVHAPGLYPAVAEGRFPITFFGPSQHDMLGHFRGYLLNSLYASTYRKLAQRLIRQGGYGALDKVQKKILYHINEHLVQVPKQALENHLHLFHLPQRTWRNWWRTIPYGRRGFTADQIYKVIQKLDTNSVFQSAKDLLANIDSLTQRLGGFAAEPNQSGKYFDKSLRGIRERLAYVERLQDLSDGRSEVHDSDLLLQAELLRKEISQLESMLLISSEISLEEWTEAVFDPSLLVRPFRLMNWHELTY